MITFGIIWAALVLFAVLVEVGMDGPTDWAWLVVFAIVTAAGFLFATGVRL